jgi:hypothetical protein
VARAKRTIPDNEARLRSLARAYTDVSIQTLGNYINGPQTEPDVKLRAIGIILDRGWGRPAQSVEHKGADGDNEIKIVLRTIMEGKP